MVDTPDRISINTLSLEPGPFDQLVAQVDRLGLAEIAPTVADIATVGAPSAAATLRAAGLHASLLTHMAFAYATPELAHQAQERLDRTIDAAHIIGAPSVCLITGGRGGHSWPEAAARFAEAIQPCARLAGEAGVALCLEPTTHLYADGSIAHRLSDAIALADMAGIEIGLDLFPCWVDADIDAAIDIAAPRSRFVQVSDYVYGDRSIPCRAPLGDGAVPLERLLARIVRAGFDGPFDIEIIGPRLDGPDRLQTLGRCVATLRGLLRDADAATATPVAE